MVQREKRVEFKFMKEMKVCYYSSMPEMVAELNAKIPAEPKTINLHLDGFIFVVITIPFPTILRNCFSWSINKNLWIGLSYAIGIQGE